MVGTVGFEGLAISAWLVWILPFVGAAIIAAVARAAGNRIRDYTAVGLALASAISAATLIPLALSESEIHSQIPWISIVNVKAGVLADPLAIVMTNLVAWISFLIFVYSTGYMHGDRDLTRYWFFMLFFIGSMQLIVLSDNLLMVFFGWEGVGLASYALIGFWYYDKKKDFVGRIGDRAAGVAMWASPTHAGMKAFLMTRAGDTMMLAGMFMIFVYSGTFGFKELLQNQAWAAQMAHQNLLVPAAVLLFGGAVGKSAQFPLNEWLLEAMTAFLLATQALVHPEIKKVLAYSTGSQIGYMMLGLGIAGLSVHFVDGYAAGFYHLMSHAMFKASLFMGAGAVLHTVGSRFMTDMGGLRKYMKKTYIFMLLASLSLAGAPLVTSGFWSKDAIFAAVLESGYAQAWPLFAIATVVAAMTAFYSFRMIGMVFFGKKSEYLEEMEHSGHHLHEVGKNMWIPFAILAVATIGIGLVGFMFEGQITHLLGGYLAHSFGIGTEGGASVPHEAQAGAAANINEGANNNKTFLGLNPIAAAASFGAFGVGSVLGYVFYIARKPSPTIISNNIVTRAIWKFLYNRWYLNSALYWGAVIGPLAIYRIIWRYFESVIIDGISPAFQYSMAYFSRVVRSGQTGITQTYLFVFGVGIMVIVMLLLLYQK